MPAGVNLIYQEIALIEADHSRVKLVNGKSLEYDFLIIATGAHLQPSETPGMQEKLWHKEIFDFYTLEGALALHDYFRDWQGGNW